MSPAPRERALILHIGLHKTGSTFIQRSLRAGADVLRAEGIAAPDLGPDPGWPLLYLLSDAPTGRVLSEGRRHARDLAPETRAIQRRDLDALLADPDIPTAILTAEQMSSNLPRPDIRALRETARTHDRRPHVICYLRAPVAFATSMAQQFVKMGGDLDRVSKRPPLPDYRRKLAPWLNVFGPEQCDLRLFDRKALIGGDVLADFLAAIGAPGLKLPELPDDQRNESLTARGMALMGARRRLLNRLAPSLATREAPALARLAARMPGPAWRLPPQTEAWVREQTAEDVAWLAETLGRDPFPA